MRKELFFYGEKINDWTIFDIDHELTKEKQQLYYFTVCKCGTKCSVKAYNLKTHSSKKCKKCANGTRTGNLSHGMSNLPEYKIWKSMKQRCHNKKNKHYRIYGKRGIFVCSDWLESFENFYKDMGKKPSNKHSIDRIDNNKGYSKDNCRWATIIEQSHNKNLIKYSGTKFKSGKWESFIVINKKSYYLGRYKTRIEAYNVYLKEKLKIKGKGHKQILSWTMPNLELSY